MIELLERVAGEEQTGLRFVDRRERERFCSWREIRERAMSVAGGLQRLGIGSGDRVALVYPTGPEFFDAFFGTLLTGGVPVPLYPPVRLGRLEEYHRQTAGMLRASGARLVLADNRVRRILGSTVERARPELGCRTLESLDAGSFRPVDVDPEDLGLVQFSSGTTVDPKPVALSHRAFVTQAALINSFWPENEGVHHTGVSWLPLYHDMGLIGCVGPALERPGVLTLLPPEAFIARPALWLRAISRHRGTISPAPNFAYALCVDRIRDEDLEGVDLSCWRVALNGAETVVPGVMRAFAERFAPFGFRESAMTPVYGLSEAALAVTFSNLATPPTVSRFDREALCRRQAQPDDSGRELTAVGRPLPGFELRIEDDHGARLEAGRIGRVKIAGPSLMSGYLGKPELTEKMFDGTWLDTGDLGFVWDGELFLTGRAKDMLLLRGRNHAPDEVERAVDEVEGVRTGCAVAASYLPDGASGEELLVLVEARKEVPAGSYEDIATECRAAVLAGAGLAAHQVIVVAPGTLPRTSSGKLRRQEALNRFLAGTLTPPEKVTALRIAKEMARSTLAYTRAGRS
ncbi:AMP-dependent synthetase [Acidobacteria bacterium Mor1]|nr:AMP-dependent synthetase [Acidobacteria bacterium Mor1]